MTEKIKIKDCPFCGGESVPVTINYHTPAEGVIITCVDCGIQTGKHKLPENAAVQWNRRVEEKR